MKFNTTISSYAVMAAVALSAAPMAAGAEPASNPVIAESPANTAPANQKNIPSLIKALGSKEYGERSHAVEALTEIGTPAVPALIEALTDTNSYTRKGAVDALGDIRPVRPEVVPALIKELIDRDSYVRKSAADALGKIGTPAVPAIIKALTDGDSSVRKGAAEALGYIGTVTPEVVPALINGLKDSDSGVRKSAAESLGKAGPATPEVIPALKKAALDEDYNVRNTVADILEKLGLMPADLKVKRHILDLGDGNSDIRKGAVDALNRIGTVTPEVMPAVIAALGDRDYSVRRSSAEFLEKRGAMTNELKAKKYVLDLEYGNKIVRIRAAEALGKIGAATPEVVPALVVAMGQKDVNAAAMEALGKIGPDAREAVPPLAKALSDKDGIVRAGAAEALGKIGPSAKIALPALMEMLKDSDSEARERAAESLKKLGAMKAGHKVNYFVSSHPFITAFAGLAACLALLSAIWYGLPVAWRLLFPLNWYTRQLNSVDSKRRDAATQALAKMGKPAVLPLIKALEHRKSDVRISAADALNRIGPLQPRAVPFVLKSLRDKESGVRRSITEVLGKTGLASTEVVPALIRALGDSDSYVRASAAEALGKCLPATSEVIAALGKTLGDNYYYVRDSAADALEKCGSMPVSLKVKRCITDLGDNNSKIRSRAVEELDKIGEEAIPELIKALEDVNSHVRRFAAVALEKHNALTVELKVKRYIIDLGDSNTNVRTRAAEALCNIGDAASEAVPRLVKLIGNSDYYVRLLAANALEKFGALNSELKVRRYILDLMDGNSDIRTKAADALGILGPDAREALPKLKKLLSDEDEIARIAAEKAIAKIESAPASSES